MSEACPELIGESPFMEAVRLSFHREAEHGLKNLPRQVEVVAIIGAVASLGPVEILARIQRIARFEEGKRYLCRDSAGVSFIHRFMLFSVSE
jgi:hypothetical protein